MSALGRTQLMVLPEVFFCLKVSESSVPPLERHTWGLSPAPSLNRNEFEILVPSVTEGLTTHREEGKRPQGQGFQATFQPGMPGEAPFRSEKDGNRVVSY